MLSTYEVREGEHRAERLVASSGAQAADLAEDQEAAAWLRLCSLLVCRLDHSDIGFLEYSPTERTLTAASTGTPLPPKHEREERVPAPQRASPQDLQTPTDQQWRRGEGQVVQQWPAEHTKVTPHPHARARERRVCSVPRMEGAESRRGCVCTTCSHRGRCGGGMCPSSTQQA